MSFHHSRLLVFLGYGAVARCLVDLLDKEKKLDFTKVLFLEPNDVGKDLASALEKGARWVRVKLDPATFLETLEELIPPGAVLTDLSVDVDSLELIRWCRKRGVLYLNASLETWDGAVPDPTLPPPQRTLYPRHQALLELRKNHSGPTAIVEHGINPGLVSAFVKAGLTDLAKHLEAPHREGESWGKLAQRLDVKVIHIAERDTQRSQFSRTPGEFVNTWSVDGFIEEALAPAEMGWGTHERRLPPAGYTHADGPQNQICLGRPGFQTKVRTWVPSGPTLGLVIRHGEAYTMSEHLTVEENGKTSYRPSVYYAYHVCEAAQSSLWEMESSSLQPPPSRRVMSDELIEGSDELGILLMGHAQRSWWFGSELSLDEARRILPGHNATTVQVAAGVAAALRWMLENPDQGVLVPDELPWESLLEAARPYLGRVTSRPVNWGPSDDDRVRTLWGPWDGRGKKADDEWQFDAFFVP